MRSHKIIFFTLLFVAVMTAAQPALALPIGGPARTLEPGGFSLTGSIKYTSMEVRDVDVTSKAFLFKGAFGGTSGVTPYFKLGFADLEADGGFKGSLDFAYGGGVLLDLITQESGAGFRVSLDGQAQWSESSEGSTTVDLFEGQLALLGSTRSSGTNGYAGIAASFISLDGAGNSEDDNGKGHLFFGVDYFMDYNFYFSAEVHLFGQDTVAVGVGYQF